MCLGLPGLLSANLSAAWSMLSRTSGHFNRCAISISGGTNLKFASWVAGVPCETVPSLLTTITESTRPISRSTRCSAIIAVIDCVRHRLKMNSRSSVAAAGSRADVGSSRIRIFCPALNAAAIATRCCCPPESSVSLRSRNSLKPVAARAMSTRRIISSRVIANCSNAKASSSRTVSATNAPSGC